MRRAAYGIGVASGTDALVLSLVACGVGPGDEVITTPFTFGATTEAIALVGATPVYVDIDACTFNMDASRIEAAITPRTRALLPVDLFGQMTDRAVLNDICARHDLRLICGRGPGHRHDPERPACRGVRRHYDAFLLSRPKTWARAGDAGMVLTNDADLAAPVCAACTDTARAATAITSASAIAAGWTRLQAVILSVKLPHLSAWNETRRRNAARYNANCWLTSNSADFTLPGCETGNHHIYHQYTIRHTRRDALQAYLKAQGVDSKVFYPLPMHLQPAYAVPGLQRGRFPHCGTHGARGAVPARSCRNSATRRSSMWPTASAALPPDYSLNICRTFLQYLQRSILSKVFTTFGSLLFEVQRWVQRAVSHAFRR